MALTEPCRERISAWRKHLDSVQNEMTDLLQQQRWFHRIHEIMANNPELKALEPKPFIGDIVAWYATYACMSIRRLTDKMDDTFSLRRLLDDLVAHSECLTRENLFEYYRGAAPTFPPDVHTRMVAGMWAPFANADDTLNLAAIQDDIATLEADAKSIYYFATHTMAHTTEKGKAIKVVPTFPELDDLIGHLDKLVTRYNHFVAGRSFMSGTNDGVELFDWRKEFRLAWMPEAV